MTTSGEGGGLPSWVRAGTKVVALWHFPDARHYGLRAPMTGQVYTIREVDPSGLNLCIRLVEIDNRDNLCDDGWEASWMVHRFRPVIEPKSEAHDLAQFRKLLDVRQPEGVDA